VKHSFRIRQVKICSNSILWSFISRPVYSELNFDGFHYTESDCKDIRNIIQL
jgi:hypothetical protein